MSKPEMRYTLQVFFRLAMLKFSDRRSEIAASPAPYRQMNGDALGVPAGELFGKGQL